MSNGFCNFIVKISLQYQYKIDSDKYDYNISILLKIRSFMISPNCPVVIPTYKNRPDNLVQHLDEISDNEIYVFCYTI